MMCTNCSKLLILNSTTKKCVKCQLSTNNNLSILCEKCSNEEKKCSICAKRLEAIQKPQSNHGCNSCGKHR